MKLKSLIVGFIAGAFAATALTAGASSIYEKYTAIARPDYKLVVDGQEVTLNNPPKIIQGSTHLPVKELGNILDKSVSFKDDTITVMSKDITSTNTELGKEYTVGSSTIKLNSVSYKENTKFNFNTDTLMAINFTVSISSDNNIYVGFDFFSHVYENGKKIMIGAEELSQNISSGKNVNVEVLIPVDSETSLKTIVLKDANTNASIEYQL